jgi:multimeric flavodoxin WrbA
VSAARSLLVVWDSRTGACAALADAAARAASAVALRAGTQAMVDSTGRNAPLAVIHRRCDDVGDDAVLAADAFLFVCPEMLGSMSGPMKHFFDRTLCLALDRLQGTPMP